MGSELLFSDVRTLEIVRYLVICPLNFFKFVFLLCLVFLRLLLLLGIATHFFPANVLCVFLIILHIHKILQLQGFVPVFIVANCDDTREAESDGGPESFGGNQFGSFDFENL